MELGDAQGAARHQLAALELGRSTGQVDLVAFSLMVAARFALEDGKRSRRGSAAVRRRCDASPARASRCTPPTSRQRMALLDAARQAAGRRGFEQASVDGASSPVERSPTRPKRSCGDGAVTRQAIDNQEVDHDHRRTRHSAAAVPRPDRRSCRVTRRWPTGPTVLVVEESLHALDRWRGSP